MSRLRHHVKRGALANWQLQYGPNMTPMVDVVMVILVFFMASTALLGPEWFLRSALPITKAKAGAPTDPDRPRPEKRFEFTLTGSGSTATTASGAGLENAPLGALLERLAAIAAESPPEDTSIVLRPGPDVPYEDLVQIHEACQTLGIVKVGMAD